MVFKIETSPPQEDDEGDGADSHPDGFYRESFESTRDFLEYIDQFGGQHPGRHLQIVPGVTSYDKEEFIERLSGKRQSWYEEEEYGEVSRLISDERKEEGVYFVRNDSSGLFTAVTNDSKSSYVDDKFIPDLNRVRNTQSLQVSSWQLRGLIEDLTESHDDATAPELHLRRRRGSSSEEIEDEFDTENKRTLSYWGEDGAVVLSHFLDTFDLRISKARVKVPEKVTFRIDESGVLKLESGSVINLLSETLEELIGRMVDGKRAYDSTNAKRISLGDTKVSQSSPALLKPREGAGFNLDTINAIIASLESRNYATVDPIIEDNPVYFTTTVYDVRNQLYFDLRGDSEAIRIFPREGSEDLRIFFKVLESVQENVDRNVKIKVMEE